MNICILKYQFWKNRETRIDRKTLGIGQTDHSVLKNDICFDHRQMSSCENTRVRFGHRMEHRHNLGNRGCYSGHAVAHNPARDNERVKEFVPGMILGCS